MWVWTCGVLTAQCSPSWAPSYVMGNRTVDVSMIQYGRRAIKDRCGSPEPCIPPARYVAGGPRRCTTRHTGDTQPGRQANSAGRGRFNFSSLTSVRNSEPTVHSPQSVSSADLGALESYKAVRMHPDCFFRPVRAGR